MSIDSVGNFLTSVRNAVARAARMVNVPYSKFKHEIANILFQEGFIKDISIVGEGIEKKLVLSFKYVKNESVIHEIRQISKPSRRVYVKSNAIPTVIDGLGIAIFTTNLGLMTNNQLKEKKIGGEFICTIW
jgi:small subunit ribosomal protein S8